MLYKCKIHCHAIDIDKANALGIEDEGKWLPFIFHLGVVIGAKMTSDETDESTYNCTTVFTEHGDSYIIDTPYLKFIRLWEEFHNDDQSKGETDTEL